MTIGILGGGIGGLTLAIALQRKNIDVVVFEAAPEWKPLGAGLGLAGNAMKAFREIDMDKEVLRASQVMKKVLIKNSRGKVLVSTDSEQVSRRFGVVNNFAIHRAELHEVLIGNVKDGTVRLNKACVDVDQNEDGVDVTFSDGSTAQVDYLVAADGIHSAARQKLLPGVTPRYAGYTCWRGVTDEIPAGIDASETCEIWGRGTRFGVAPCGKNRVFWYACVNAKPNDPMMKSLTSKDLLTFFGDYYSPIPDLIRNTDKIIWGDIIDIEPITQFAFGKIVLMGDAAHATTPNMGQGACMAIEDAVVLSNLVAGSQSIEQAFKDFEQKRVRRTTKVVNDSWQIGKVAQWENPFMTTLRDFAMSLLPPSFTENQFKFIYDISLK